MKIDLHVHASERSECSRAPEQAQIRAAIAAGLDALAFTDHYRFVPLEQLQMLNQQYAPFKIFSGIEVTADGEDFLVLGVRDATLENERLAYPALHALVRAHNGFIALAHPYRYRDHVQADVEHYAPDAIEIHSVNIRPNLETKISALATRLHLPTLCDSDAHTTDAIGKYFNVLTHTPKDEPALIATLRNGALTRCAS